MATKGSAYLDEAGMQLALVLPERLERETVYHARLSGRIGAAKSRCDLFGDSLGRPREREAPALLEEVRQTRANLVLLRDVT